MGQPLTTDNIGPYISEAFSNAFKDVVLPGLDTITTNIEELKTNVLVLKADTKDVKKRLGNVEEEVRDVKKDMTTKDDLSNLETRLNKRLKAVTDVQSNLSERVDKLESPSMIYA